MAAARLGLWPGLVVFALFLLLFLTGLAPFGFEFPLGDMEGSWILASVYAGLHRFAYGTQFVFTNGPLFPLYHRDWADGASGWYVLGRLALVLYFAWGFSRLADTGRPMGWAILAAAALLLWPTVAWQANDGILLAIPLLAGLLAITQRDGWAGLVAGIVVAAAIGLGKVSFIPFCLVVFVLVDIAALSRRRLPLATLGYAAASFGLFVVAGQRPGDFVPFLAGSAEMAAAYTPALAVDGPLLELWLFLVLCTFTLLVAAGREFSLVRAGEERPLLAVLRLLLAAGTLFMALKAGFVRHDTHSVAGWGLLIMLLILLGLPRAVPAWRARFSWTLYAPMLLALVGICSLLFATGQSLSPLTTTPAGILARQLTQSAAFARDPTAWLAGQQQQSDAAYAHIRAATPLPPLTGRVDALSNIQGAVIAAGLDFAPRPTLQENMTASPALIARNAAYLSGPAAPDHLLFAPGATDDRHPASVEGSLWPLLLSDYAIAGEAAGQLILDRRPTPAPVTAAAPVAIATGFGEDVALPNGQPLLLRLDIRETLLGRLADFVFKPPLLHLVVSYADGRSETYRLIPGMIREGMVISPTIRTIADYRALAAGNIGGLDAPTAIQVETTGSWAYDAAVTGTLAALAVPAS
jgi:hypothetical protein